MLRRYNPAVKNCLALRVLLLTLLAGLVLLVLGGCDYPEQGYYSLTGYDAGGKAVVHHPFQIEELVDDTGLTYGFALHLYDSAHKTVIDRPIDNVPELTRRGWLVSLGNNEYGRGDLALDFTHVDQLSFVGAWRAKSGDKPYPLAGSIEVADDPDPSRVDLDLPLPPVEGTENHAVRFVVEMLNTKQFVALLGAPLKSFKHVKGSAPQSLDPELGRKAGAVPAGSVARSKGE
jgi:hypothetical protein